MMKKESEMPFIVFLNVSWKSFDANHHSMLEISILFLHDYLHGYMHTSDIFGMFTNFSLEKSNKLWMTSTTGGRLLVTSNVRTACFARCIASVFV